jgi:hypothetical protein
MLNPISQYISIQQIVCIILLVYGRDLFWSSKTSSFAPMVPVRPPTPKVMFMPRFLSVFSSTAHDRVSCFLSTSSTCIALISQLKSTRAVEQTLVP